MMLFIASSIQKWKKHLVTKIEWICCHGNIDFTKESNWV